jgi:hypothetical protein
VPTLAGVPGEPLITILTALGAYAVRWAFAVEFDHAQAARCAAFLQGP